MMSTFLQVLLDAIEELESCVFNAKQVIMQSNEGESASKRLDFYDEALLKINNEVRFLTNSSLDVECEELDQSVKRIVALSEMIKQDTIDLLLAVETGFNSNFDTSLWN